MWSISSTWVPVYLHKPRCKYCEKRIIELIKSEQSKIEVK